MPENVVWSELNELPGVVGLHDCTYCANLMVLVAAGKRTFPRGIYTPAEREELEREDDHPNRIGADHEKTDLAILRRYGVTMRKLQNGTRVGLQRALEDTRRAYAVAGDCLRLPPNVRVAGCGGAHDVCVIPQGNGKVLWLDPMEKMGFVGKVLPIDTVLNYAFLNPVNDARFLEFGELEEELEEEMIDPNRHIPVAVCAVASGGTVFADPDRRTILIRSWVGQSTVGLYANVRGPIGSPAPLVPIRISVSGQLKVGWVGADKVSDIRLPTV